MTDLRKTAEIAAKVLANALSIDFNDKRDWYSYKHDVEYAANLLCQALAQPEHPLDKKADNARELGLDYEPEQNPFNRLIRIMGTFDLATGHADGWDDLLDSLESELRDVLGHYREALKQDHGFDRTASHMAGEYVDTAQSEPIVIMGHYVGEGKVVSASFGLPEGSFDMSTKQQNIDTSEERVQKSDKSIHEPVAWLYNGHLHECDPSEWAIDDVVPLYTAPPKREWVGLTDEEILSFVAFEPHPLMNRTSIIHAVQAKLREKNGY